MAAGAHARSSPCCAARREAHGGFALQPHATGAKAQWLLIKRRDEHAAPDRTSSPSSPAQLSAGARWTTCAGERRRRFGKQRLSFAGEPGVFGEQQKGARHGKIVGNGVRLAGCVMEDPRRSRGLQARGWTFEIDRGADGDKFKLDETIAPKRCCSGAPRTKASPAAWPTMEGEFATSSTACPST